MKGCIITLNSISGSACAFSSEKLVNVQNDQIRVLSGSKTVFILNILTIRSKKFRNNKLSRNPHTSAAITEALAGPEGTKWQAKSLVSDVTQATDSLPYARNRTENLETLLFKVKTLSEALKQAYAKRQSSPVAVEIRNLLSKPRTPNVTDDLFRLLEVPESIRRTWWADLFRRFLSYFPHFIANIDG